MCLYITRAQQRCISKSITDVYRDTHTRVCQRVNNRLVPKVSVIYGACHGVFFRERKERGGGTVARSILESSENLHSYILIA